MQDKSAPPEPPSCPLSRLSNHSCPASSLSHSHSRALTPGVAPPSAVNSSVTDPSNSAPSSHLAWVLPRRAALTSAVRPRPQPAVPVTMSKVQRPSAGANRAPHGRINGQEAARMLCPFFFFFLKEFIFWLQLYEKHRSCCINRHI